ncbi:MAG: hypothetical protein HFG26_05125 [Provencibacterium sp.]|jgi:putative aldouronate transport system substrate-binding protein|nr:hypothetical protein [Provencibacterium sp.]
MKKHSKWLPAAALATAVLTGLTACSGNGAPPSQSSSAASSSSRAGAPESSAVSQDGGLPLVQEKETLRFWFYLPAANGISDYNDSDYYQWLEEKTNVHIEWIIPVEGTETESFNLIFASDNMPDLIMSQGSRSYKSGPDVAIADGVYLRLNDLCDQLAPNYMALINADPALQKDTLTDEGNRWAFNYLYKDGRLGNQGPTIRQDFLDKVSMEVPVTFEDWHKVLTAFKTQLGVEIPLFYGSSDNDGTTGDSEFLTGFNTAREFYLDGKEVKYGPMQDGYGEYLEMMKQWYAEGLIDQSFSTRNGVLDDDLILNDKIGAVIVPASYSGSKYYPDRGAVNPEFNLVGAPIPVKKAGDTTHVRNADLLTNTMSIAVSGSTKFPELCVRWMDYQYTEEASFASNYGVREGESYVVEPDGSYKWGELITNNPDGLTQNQARSKFTTLNAPFEDYTRVMGAWSETQLAAQQIWQGGLDDGVISPAVTMTEAEQEEYASIMGDIKTYVAEYTVGAIMNQNTPSFEDFRAQLTSMGIERATELKQAGVDRYNER